MAQRGIMSTYQLSAHNHLNANQGGIINTDDLSIGTILRVYRANVLTFPTGAFTKVPFDTEDFDIGANFAGGTWTCPATAYYNILANVSIDQLADGKRVLIHIYLNGASILMNDFAQGTAGLELPLLISSDEYLTIGDTIDVYVYQASGGNAFIEIGRDSSFLCISKLGV